MGTETDQNILVFCNGQPFTSFEEITVSCQDDNKGIKYFGFNSPTTFTMTAKYPKVKRKKLIKLLVEYGYPEKLAKRIVWYLNRNKIRYGKVYSTIFFTGGDLSFLNYTNTRTKR